MTSVVGDEAKNRQLFWAKTECGLVLSSVTPWEIVSKEKGVTTRGYMCKHCQGKPWQCLHMSPPVVTPFSLLMISQGVIELKTNPHSGGSLPEASSSPRLPLYTFILVFSV